MLSNDSVKCYKALRSRSNDVAEKRMLTVLATIRDGRVLHFPRVWRRVCHGVLHALDHFWINRKFGLHYGILYSLDA